MDLMHTITSSVAQTFVLFVFITQGPCLICQGNLGSWKKRREEALLPA
jgi:hypothetical protein